MLRFLMVAIPSFALGAVSGAFLWYAFSPLLFDDVVNETLVQTAQAQVLATGQFNGADAVHKAMGEAKLIQQADGQVELQFSGFEVTNGPDLKVWVLSNPDPKNGGDVKDGVELKVAPLKGNVGDQSYMLPAGVDVSNFKSVVIYCEQFSVLFGHATLA